MTTTNRILVLFAHPAPHKSRVNRRLIQAVAGLESVTVHDLYESYPDLLIHVRKEQDLLREHDIIVLQHPFFWYSVPAIIKEWLDLVLEYGFAYGENGIALRGKKMMNAITTGGPEASYQKTGFNRFTIREFLAPFDQTAHLCEMEYLPPHVIHGTHQLDPDGEIAQLAENYRRLILALRDNAVDWERLRATPMVRNSPGAPLSL